MRRFASSPLSRRATEQHFQISGLLEQSAGTLPVSCSRSPRRVQRASHPMPGGSVWAPAQDCGAKPAADTRRALLTCRATTGPGPNRNAGAELRRVARTRAPSVNLDRLPLPPRGSPSPFDFVEANILGPLLRDRDTRDTISWERRRDDRAHNVLIRSKFVSIACLLASQALSWLRWWPVRPPLPKPLCAYRPTSAPTRKDHAGEPRR